MAIRTPVVVLSCALVVKDLAKGFSVVGGHRRKEGGRGGIRMDGGGVPL